MPLEIKTTEVQPKQEDKKFEIEVLVSYYDSSVRPFVHANIVGDGLPYAPPDSKLNERYVFKITSPFINREASND